MKVIWSPLGEQRALEAVTAIANERPNAAAAWLDELLERVADLGRFPRLGREVPEIRKPQYRQIQHYPYRVIYRIDPKQVVILTVRHGRQDWSDSEVPAGA